MFKNGVGRPSNLTIKRRRNFLICMIVILAAILCVTVTFTVKYFSISGKGKNAVAILPIIPVYTTTNKVTTTISPTKTFEINVSTNKGSEQNYTAGQGMTRVDVNGKWYILTAVVQDNRVTENVRASTPTYIYIINEKTGKVEAIVADQSYSHANSMAYDGKYIYIWRGKQTEEREDGSVNVKENAKVFVLDKKYVSDAVARGGKITSSFTSKYLIYGDKLTTNVSMASLVYDKQTGKLYGSNKANFYEINITGSGNNAKLNYTKMFTQVHIDEHKSNGKYVMTNAGAVIYKDYLLLGRYYSKGIPGTSGKKNSIDIFKITRNSSGKITSPVYVASYVFNDKILAKGEIEDLELVDNETLLIHYNYGRSLNKLYYLDLKQLNYSKVKVYKGGTVVKKNAVTATVYNSSNKVVGSFTPNSNGNLVIRNLPAGRYKAVITGITGNKKTGPFVNSKGKSVTFDVSFYNPYQLIRFDI